MAALNDPHDCGVRLLWTTSNNICLSNSSTGQIAYVVMRLALVLEVRGSNLRLFKSNTELPTACHRFDFSWKRAVLPMRNTASIMKV